MKKKKKQFVLINYLNNLFLKKDLNIKNAIIEIVALNT